MDEPTLPGPALLREWRKAEDISQAEAAARIGVKQSVFSLRETGDRGVPLGDALIIQTVTRGKVPATAWGHSVEDIERALAAGDYQLPDSDEHDAADDGPPAPTAETTLLDGTPTAHAA